MDGPLESDLEAQQPPQAGGEGVPPAFACCGRGGLSSVAGILALVLLTQVCERAAGGTSE